MNYAESIKYLEEFQKFGKKNGLENINIILDNFSRPEESYDIIHVAGTNGKGSVSALLNRLFSDKGYKVGQFSSPHINTYNERIRIGEKQISDEDFAYTMSLIGEKVSELFNKAEIYPTFFEILTAQALLYFQMKKCDLVILECGLGGRYDSTNAVKSPLITAITSIGKDHTEYLGDTIEQITREKCGIIKKNIPVCVGIQSEVSYKIIESFSKRHGAKTYYAKDYEFNDLLVNLEETSFIYDGKRVFSKLIGFHQIDNIKLFISIVKAFNDVKGTRITRKEIIDAVERVNWQGRLEKISDEPFVMIDSAHNPPAAKALRSIFQVDSRRKIAIVGFLESKDYTEIIDMLQEYIHLFVITEPNFKQKRDKLEIAEYMDKTGARYTISADINDSVKIALKEYKRGDVIIAFGSMYLIGDIKKIFMELLHE